MHTVQNIYRLNAIPIKILVAIFIEIKKKNPKTHMEPQKMPNSKDILSEKRKVEALHFLISNYITELSKAKQHGSEIRKDMSINEIEQNPQKTQKQTHPLTVN